MSSARVNRPTSCSSWAIRSAEASDCLSAGSKRVDAFSRSCRFHFESCSSLRLCRRHTSAWELSPLRASRTTSALNSEVKFRFRFRCLREWPSAYSFQVKVDIINILTVKERVARILNFQYLQCIVISH